MMRRIVVVLTTSGLVLLAIPASADHGSITDTKGDATGCGVGRAANCDIVSATYGHRSNGRLMHTVTVDGKIGDPGGSGPQNLPRLYIDVPGQKFDNPTCDFFIDSLPPGAGPNTSDHYQYYVETCQNSGAQVRGPAAAVQVDANTLRIVFKRKRIGSPSHYGWQFAFPQDGDNPAYDQAPNKGYKRHDI